MNPPRLSHRDGRRSQVVFKQPGQVTAAQAQLQGKVFHAAVVQATLADVPQGPRHGGRGAQPGRCTGGSLGAAPLAGPEPRLFSCGGTQVEFHVLAARSHRRAHGPAVDSGGFHAGEEPAVETGVAALDGAVTDVGIEFHDPQSTGSCVVVSPFSDIEWVVVDLEIRGSSASRAEKNR